MHGHSVWCGKLGDDSKSQLKRYQFPGRLGSYFSRNRRWSYIRNFYSDRNMTVKLLGLFFLACSFMTPAPVSVRFATNLADIPGATQLQLRLATDPASVLSATPVSCPGGSCSLTVDPSQGTWFMRLQYLNSGGSVLASSDLQEIYRPHYVVISWTPSSSSGVLINFLYRGTTSGGPYSRRWAIANFYTSAIDTGVVPGQTYYYVMTAWDVFGSESGNSDEAIAAIPSP